MFNRPTIGADPEVFVRDAKTGKFITAEGLISGTKLAPTYGNHGGYQVDGVAAEFNVNTAPLGKRSAEFVGNVVRIHKEVAGIIKCKNKSAELVAVPTADFDEDYFKSLSEESRELGCDPDFNGYTGDPNIRPKNDVCYRTGSGHVHVGWQMTNEDAKRTRRPIWDGWDVGDNDHFEKGMALAVELDFYLGLPSLLWDADSRRRSLYGRAGAFRPKIYGMEYRVLSNVWVSDKRLIAYVYDQTNTCVETFDQRKLFNEYGMAAAEIINSSDVAQARELMTAAGIKFPEF